MQLPDRRFVVKSADSPLDLYFLFEVIFHPKKSFTRFWLIMTVITCFELHLKANDGRLDVTHGPGPDGALRVSLTCRLTPDGETTKRTTGVDITLVHDVHPDGTLSVSMHALAAKSMPPFPRVGLRMRCPADMQSVNWFGRGPHECYPDRKASAMIGLHSSSVDDMHVPYIVPSENGGRADVRWFSIRRASLPQPRSTTRKSDRQSSVGNIRKSDSHFAPGLLVSLPSNKHAQISVQRHSLEALDAASHTHELEAALNAGDGSVHVHVDHMHMGVGGDDSWTPNVHPEYLIEPGKLWSCGMHFAVLPCDVDAFVLHRQLQGHCCPNGGTPCQLKQNI